MDKNDTSMNAERPSSRLITLFLAILAAISLLAAGLILFSPDDVPMSAPYNRGGNLLNGGNIAIGDGILFYCRPDDGGIYSAFGDTVTRIGEGGAGPSFATAEGYVYTEGQNLVQILYNGSAKLLLLENAQEPLIIGRWMYYLEDGQLTKQRMDDGKTSPLGLYPGGNYYIAARRIFYIGQDGKLWTALTDGSENRLFADTQMTDFIIQGSYIYYRDAQGMLCWFNTASPATITRHEMADKYNCTSTHLVYEREGKLYAMAFSDQRVEQIGEGVFQNLSCDNDYIYYFDENSDFVRIRPDGSEKQVWGK